MTNLDEMIRAQKAQKARAENNDKPKVEPKVEEDLGFIDWWEFGPVGDHFICVKYCEINQSGDLEYRGDD